MRDTRDMRDPTLLWEEIKKVRPQLGWEIVCKIPVENYSDNGIMSSDPEEHHSKTPQHIGDLYDGGGA